MNIIKWADVDQKAFENDYAELQKELHSGEKIEVLFKKNGEFSGHLWDWNCVYTESDLERNGDYRLSDEDLRYALNI